MERKTKQLCAQVRRVVSQFLSLECSDEILQSLYVESVEPAPDATCMLVTLNVPQELEVERAEVLALLDQVKPTLRSEIGRTINRRKTPDLNFVLIRSSV